MSLKDQIEANIRSTFRSRWRSRNGTVVPDAASVSLENNEVVVLDAAVLYADMSDSTSLVDSEDPLFAAEIYKTFLYAAGQIVRHKGGSITAYDGDRIMAVFIGENKEESAVRAALLIKGAVRLINSAITANYPASNYQLKYKVGIDTSQVHVARVGVRAANDLVWVGRAANHAAKMCAIRQEPEAWISFDVYRALPDGLLVSKESLVWTLWKWSEMNERPVFSSDWYIEL